MPRSRCAIPSNPTTSTIGASGMSSCIGSSSLLHLLVRIVAATATSPSLANSEGWIVTGPRSIQRDAP